MGKLGTVLVCLLFAVPFGGVGVFASWAIGSTLVDAYRVRDWVPVPATVERSAVRESEGSEGGSTFRAEGLYRYEFEGAPYSGSRLGISRRGGSDNIDDWHQAVVARLEEARAAGRPVTVWVNPEEPWDSVFDRGIRWSEILFLMPFALAFGGVGVGALVALVYVVRGGEGTPSVQGGRTGVQGAGWLWIFAFFWNSISWPIAILAVREVMQTREWLGLLVLLFPLVGIGLVWGAAAASWKALVESRRAGNAPPQAMPRPVPGAFAAQAARAMFDPKDAAASPRPAEVPVAIPAAIATVEERPGTLTIRYSRRRHLGAGLVLLTVGAVFTVAGVAIAVAGDALAWAAVAIAVGAALDAWAVSLLASRLEVTVKGRALAVGKSGLLGRRSWQARGEAVDAVRTSVTHSVNEVPYHAVHAHLRSGERIPVGDGIKGAALADAIARRIGGALGLDASQVQGEAMPSRNNDSPREARAGGNQ